MSRFVHSTQRAEARRASLPADWQPVAWESGARPFRVVTVTSNKGGVGKTTIATNLAIYLRALREDLPILVLGFDEQPLLDQMFALEPGTAQPTRGQAEAKTRRPTLADALRGENLTRAVRFGQYGVHYVPTSRDIAQLKREIWSPFELQGFLLRTRWRGLVIIDTKSDLEILTQNAIAAGDLTVVVVKDPASVIEAEQVFHLFDEWQRPRDRARILLALVDRRVRYQDDEKPDALSLLVAETRGRGFPLFETFISRSPTVEALYTNPEARALSILHSAGRSLVHRQMRQLAEEVLAALDRIDARRGEGFRAPSGLERARVRPVVRPPTAAGLRASKASPAAS